ncbi:hypothetical protein [Lysinibacter cavernae]|uniref:hypothetical protein n=1 Tax=Lysinibacter cavernae TaxID=1640652 RepID=UPI0036D87CE2
MKHTAAVDQRLAKRVVCISKTESTQKLVCRDRCSSGVLKGGEVSLTVVVEQNHHCGTCRLRLSPREQAGVRSVSHEYRDGPDGLVVDADRGRGVTECGSGYRFISKFAKKADELREVDDADHSFFSHIVLCEHEKSGVDSGENPQQINEKELATRAMKAWS